VTAWPDVRTGFGFDVHAFGNEGPVILGGTEIPHEKGLVGHSDADAVAHAIIDALLGAAGLGDIGEHFPETDDAYAGAYSLGLLSETCRKIRAEGWDIANADVTVICQRPRLGERKAEMRGNLATTLQIPSARVNVKATTTEKMGFMGRGEGLGACALVTLTRPA